MEIPKTGEIWQHECGDECLVLGAIDCGDSKAIDLKIVVYEIGRERYWRSLENFVSRFNKVDTDMDEEIWAQTAIFK